MPELDSNIFAECESLLLNFDKIVEKEFGLKYCLRESLSFALQLFPSSETLRSATKSNKDYESVLSFINQYRSSISTDILNTGEYAFKAFLIQVANYKSKDALPVQFLSYDNPPCVICFALLVYAYYYRFHTQHLFHVRSPIYVSDDYSTITLRCQ